MEQKENKKPMIGIILSVIAGINSVLWRVDVFYAGRCVYTDPTRSIS